MTTAPAPRADQAALRYTATTRDGRCVAIEVRRIPGALGGGFVGHMWTRKTVDQALSDALRQHAVTSPFVEVLAEGDPPRAALLAQVAGLRAALERIEREWRTSYVSNNGDALDTAIVAAVNELAALATKAGT